MSPDRKVTINNKKIEEFYWGRKLVVYVDHHAVSSNFDQTCQDIINNRPIKWEKK